MLSNDVSALIGFACESVFYGAYTVVFVLSLTFLSWRRRTRATTWPMIIGTCLLFALCTAHFAIEFNHFYNKLSTGSVSRFSAETTPLFASDILISLIDFVGDLVLLYRCWMVWGQNYWVILLPFLTATSGFVCAMIGLSLVLKIDPTAPIAPESIVPLGIASFALPLATNFLVTTLIVSRIYYMASYIRDVQAVSTVGNMRDRFNHAAAIVIESGMLYLIFQLVLVILFAIKHPAQAIVGVAAVQVYGIAPTLISFRVGLGITPEQTHTMNMKRSTIPYGTSTANNEQSTIAMTNMDSEYGTMGPSTSAIRIHMSKLNSSELSAGYPERDATSTLR